MAQKKKVEVIENPYGAMYTVRQVGAMLQVSRPTVIRAIRDRRLKAKLIGRGYRITKADFEDYVSKAPDRAPYGMAKKKK